MDRFDLEDQINNLLNISDDLNLLSRNIQDEEAADILRGLSGLIKLRHAQLFETMKIIFNLNDKGLQKTFI